MSLLLGVLPTPAVAFLTDDLGADLGVVISASHNAMPDNGIKIFAAGGLKLDDAVEDADRAADGRSRLRCRPARGSAGSRRAVDADRRYLDHLLVATPNPLNGLRVVVDCAHGAASDLAPEVYRRAGAEVIVIGGQPGRAEHQRRRRFHLPGRAARGRCAEPRPTSASPTTATPTAAWPSRPTAPTWTATSSWRCWRCR